jgi:hypothetical protein
MPRPSGGNGLLIAIVLLVLAGGGVAVYFAAFS